MIAPNFASLKLIQKLRMCTKVLFLVMFAMSSIFKAHVFQSQHCLKYLTFF